MALLINSLKLFRILLNMMDVMTIIGDFYTSSIVNVTLNDIYMNDTYTIAALYQKKNWTPNQSQTPPYQPHSLCIQNYRMSSVK